MSNTVLELKNISKDFRQGKTVLEVLSNINLKISAGESVAIIGDSGSGKSTLLHIAGLLDAPDGGEVLHYTGKPFVSKEMLRLKHIGFVYQYHHLLPDFSARENIVMPRIIAGDDKDLATDEADELLSYLDLEERSHNLPGELSGGQQQRVAICRALINKPGIVLADEPTGNLDPNSAQVVFDLLLRLTKSNHMALLMVTHNHHLAARMDRVYELKNGALVSAEKL